MQSGGANNENGNAESDMVCGTDGRTINALCYKCGQYGHVSYNCPEEDRRINDGTGFMQFGVSLTKDSNSSHLISRDWLLLDTCSTDNVIYNTSMVANIRKCRKYNELRMHTNGGYKDYDMVNELKLLPLRVHVNKRSIANVLSFRKVAGITGCRIKMHTAEENTITVAVNKKSNEVQALQHQ